MKDNYPKHKSGDPMIWGTGTGRTLQSLAAFDSLPELIQYVIIKEDNKRQWNRKNQNRRKRNIPENEKR